MIGVYYHTYYQIGLAANMIYSAYKQPYSMASNKIYLYLIIFHVITQVVKSMFNDS